MPGSINFSFLSDQIQNCFNKLFNEVYHEKQEYREAVLETSIYLIDSSDKYDYVLEKYTNITKELLNQMILSNFLEVTYYRRKNNIPIDNERLNINTVEKKHYCKRVVLTYYIVMLNS